MPTTRVCQTSVIANRTRTLLIMLLVMFLAGCAHLEKDNQETDSLARTPTQPEPTEKAEIQEKDFDPDTLYALLSAEIAGQRGRFDIALLDYVQQAEKTRDPGVIRRAVQIARYMKAENALGKLGRLWAEVEPDALEAHDILVFDAVNRNDFETAMHHLERVLELGGEADFEALALHAKTLPIEQQRALYMQFRELADRHPENPDIVYGYALVARTLKQYQESLEIIDRYLEDHPDYQQGLLLKATLLYDLGKIKESLDMLSKATQAYPDNRKLATLYARMLIDDGNLARSKQEYTKLVERYPDIPGLRLALGLVSLETGDRETAREQFEALIRLGHNINEAHFYLGKLADDAGDISGAIKHYQQVSSGSHYFNALARASYLRANQGELDDVLRELATYRKEQPEKEENYWQVEINILLELEDAELALKKVNEALEAYPENTSLLYARAMLHEKFDRIDALEQDLRTILKRQPDNPIALNALGYTLADKTDRYVEAYELITKAAKLNPNSPAVIDSLGWIHYRMGDIDKALLYLKKAYARFPDPEVAAHYGEVLWISGDKKKAKKIWKSAYDKDPGHKVLTSTLKRFGVSFQ